MLVTPHSGKPPSTGYYLVEGTGVDVLAVYGAGVVRWYRQFDTFAAETKIETDGTFTTFVGNTMGFQPLPGQYTRYSPDGTRIADYKATSPDKAETGKPTVYTDNHDSFITKNARGGSTST